MATATAREDQLTTEDIVGSVLANIDREREREIISRRFGLYDRKETLEQIGEMLGITRERVRQLEKSIVGKLKAASEQGNMPEIKKFQTVVHEKLEEMGGISKISTISEKLVAKSDRNEQSRIAFLAQLSPELSVILEDDYFFASVAIKELFNEKQIKDSVAKIIESIKKFNEPKSIDAIAKAAGIADTAQAEALASTSKGLACLNDQWGLVKWPMVNPKNIRDKIYVILKENGKHMHFNEIAEAIKESDFKRRDVTTQAIHNELIKDKRFVLIGRGIYALKEWGYEKGTVADIITDVLKEANQPLHRDEIVKRVLESRFVKETTILLNLQAKPQFKRVAKATYELSEE